MTENNGYRTVAIIALVLGVIGVSLGYVAFSSTLTITTTAEVVPDASKFNVDFSSSAATTFEEQDITPTLSQSNDANFTATDAEIDNTSDPTLTNLHAHYTEPGQTVTYDVYAYNRGEYVAYLNSITFDSTTNAKACTPRTGTDATMVAAACDDITLTVTVGSTGPTTTTVDPISNHSLGIGASELVTVVIEYASGAAIADGGFDVTFPDIVLTYDSVD